MLYCTLLSLAVCIVITESVNLLQWTYKQEWSASRKDGSISLQIAIAIRIYRHFLYDIGVHIKSVTYKYK